jgi:hypothetical protein
VHEYIDGIKVEGNYLRISRGSWEQREENVGSVLHEAGSNRGGKPLKKWNHVSACAFFLATWTTAWGLI